MLLTTTRYQTVVPGARNAPELWPIAVLPPAVAKGPVFATVTTVALVGLPPEQALAPGFEPLAVIVSGSSCLP